MNYYYFKIIIIQDENDDCETFEEVVEKALEKLTVNEDELRRFSDRFYNPANGGDRIQR